jgi:methylated-DNA-[protein]-cysteine S-methyltransferase
MHSVISSPVGSLCVGIDDDGVLRELWLPNRTRHHRDTTEGSSAAHDTMHIVRAQLEEYFCGNRRAFDLPIDPRGTEFERRVWKRLREIPFGATATYGELAKEFGMRNGARAVGRANGANPIPIVIPCHRVIGSNGSLVGFGGGLPLKLELLRLEGALLL